MAEKILLLAYLIGLPLSFRALIKTMAPNNYLVSYFIFPFTYSFVFFLGFYNFSLALVFLLITLNFWIKNETKSLSIKKVMSLFILITLTYFSHIFIFSILIFLIGLHILINGTIEWINNFDRFKTIFITSLKKSGVLLLSSSIPLLLFFSYFISRPTGNHTYINHSELIEWLKNIRPIIAFNTIEEGVFTEKLFYLFASLFVVVIYNTVRFFYNFSFKTRLVSMLNKNIRVSFFWFIALVSILFMYLKIPDANGSAGFISIRLGLLFFIILILWISTQRISKKIITLLVVLTLYYNFKLNSYYSSEIKKMNKIAVECNNAADYISPNSIVLPLNYSENWLYGHFSNYLGIDKPMIILENYECSTGYFPINWNEKSIPNTLIGMKKNKQYACKQWKTNQNNSDKEIDYVFILGNIDVKKDSCNLLIKHDIFEDYTLVYSTENCQLYKYR